MIKINISIEADSVEAAKEAFTQLGSGATVSAAPSGTVEATPAAPVEKPKTRARATTPVQEAVVIPIGDPLAAAPAADPLAVSAQVADPLAGATTTPSADPLAASTPVADPLAAAPAATSTPTPPAATGTIPLQTIRDKIGTLGDKKQKCKDLIATYKKADGSPCERPSDIQEKDYAAVYEVLDYV